MASLANIRVNIGAPFPAKSIGSTGINLIKANGIWTIKLDVSGFSVTTPGNSPTAWHALVYNTSLASYALARIEPSAVVTKTADFTVGDYENDIVCDKAADTLTMTLPAAASWPGRCINVKTVQAQLVVSASDNVVPLAGGDAADDILADTAGKWARLVSDGVSWVIMAAG